MPKIKLEKLSMEELDLLGKDVRQAKKDLEKRTRDDALAAVHKVVGEYGLSIKDLLGETGGKSKGAARAPKYRHPENPSQTWSGRGRQPAWLKEGLAEGKVLEDYLI